MTHLKFAYQGNCDDQHCEDCYFNSQDIGEIYNTAEEAAQAAEEHFPGGNQPRSPFNYQVFEIKK